VAFPPIQAVGANTTAGDRLRDEPVSLCWDITPGTWASSTLIAPGFIDVKILPKNQRAQTSCSCSCSIPQNHASKSFPKKIRGREIFCPAGAIGRIKARRGT
jgi:hypothetical protein